ncbi:hypothetical protein [Methanobrevibacter sp.]|uniref:hypothetical protein n=1 Tax=Methanobrevibacter sp. TaxID=66852 RepID=UPI0026E0C492|nr:hypothetical protein [Methanobrevibacter sp.]MDO5824354.1 hypothetical protein [Methanobrevibacter sp.]
MIRTAPVFRHSTWLDNIRELDSFPEILRKTYETKSEDIGDEKIVIELEEWLKDNPEYSFLVE